MHHFAALALHRVRDDPRTRSYSYSPFQTALLVPAAHFLRPGFASLLRSPELRESGAPRDVRVFARHPLDTPDASKTRVNALMTRRVRRLRGALRPMTRDARLSA